MSRTRVARTRLTEAEYAEHVEAAAAQAGVKASEFLRRIIVGRRDLEARLTSIESRLKNLETEVASFDRRVWEIEKEARDG